MPCKKILFFILILGTFTNHATHAKEMGCQKPTITVELSKSTPLYTSKPYPELVTLCQNHENILGCTVGKYICSHKVHLNQKGCKQLDFKCHPDDFHVYIVNDYPKETCEYNAIKKHENFHVRAYQNFSQKAIKAYLNKCVDEEIEKKQIKTGEQIYMKCAYKANIWMNSKIEEKNREIDSYKKYDPVYFSDCKNWKMHSWEIKAHLDMKD